MYIDVTMGADVCTFDGFSTVGDGMGGFGSISALLSASAIFCRALHVGYPASKLGVVVVIGGVVRMVIISVAACLKKSSKSTFGIEISLGKRVNVSTSITKLVGWKNI